MSDHKPNESTRVVVQGDLTIDRHLVEMPGAAALSVKEVRTWNDPGGAALLAALIRLLLDAPAVPGPVIIPPLPWPARIRSARLLDAPAVPGPVIPPPALSEEDPAYPTTFHVWSGGAPDDGKGKEKAGGNHSPRGRPPIQLQYEDCLGRRRPATDWVGGDRGPCCSPVSPSVIALDDLNLGFRQTRSLWPLDIRVAQKNSPPPWVVLKTTHPVLGHNLWQQLQEKLRNQLVVVISADDLRALDIQLSQELTWERLAADFLDEEKENLKKVAKLTCCFQVVVLIDTAGAMILSQHAGGRQGGHCRLVFDPDPKHAPEGRGARHAMPRLQEYWVAASIARRLLGVAPDNDRAASAAVLEGVRAGLFALRSLRDCRRQLPAAGHPRPPLALAYPHDDLQAAINEGARKDKPQFSFIELPLERPGKQWTILGDKIGHRPRDLWKKACEVVERGPEDALRDVPTRRFGDDLHLADPREIEGVLGIRRLFVEYLKTKHHVPLSIAVFGAPGSGKSFVVKELARSMVEKSGSFRPGQKMEFLTFNLSQLNRPEDLLGPLHQVRDSVLSGVDTVAFWDEFDSDLMSQPYGWLRYFLAPMQDGKFQEGQITHSVGGAFFVFAGGTCHRMQDFGPRRGSPVPPAAATAEPRPGSNGRVRLPGRLDAEPSAPGGEITEARWKQFKGPDFVSRLRGYLNVLGPNPDPPGGDPLCVIRRAILLRSFLAKRAGPGGTTHKLFHKKGQPGKVDIDPGVLGAFLGCRSYRHGARSMEAIVDMSLLVGRDRFDRSALPSREQLALHVDSDDFIRKIYSPGPPSVPPEPLGWELPFDLATPPEPEPEAESSADQPAPLCWEISSFDLAPPAP